MVSEAVGHAGGVSHVWKEVWVGNVGLVSTEVGFRGREKSADWPGDMASRLQSGPGARPGREWARGELLPGQEVGTGVGHAGTLLRVGLGAAWPKHTIAVGSGGDWVRGPLLSSWVNSIYRKYAGTEGRCHMAVVRLT